MTNEPRSAKYDVFLCLLGPDIRYTFAGNLYNALRRNRIKTFFKEDNDELVESGDQISPSALRAIKESGILILVLSQNFASSSRCLDDLVAIHQCMDRRKPFVLPVFYKVEIRDVRHWQDSFEDYEERVKQWKEALSIVYRWTRLTYQTGYEYEFIGRIVDTAKRFSHRYDVFLSFSGEDTRYSFTGFLYNAFCREGFKIFMDDEGLQGGKQISQTLMGAIEKSRLSIVVFSGKYGRSTWCLDELAKIIECMKTKNQMVWPIFYNVEKSDVCNQTKSYGQAMAKHEERFGNDSEKVQKWRSALSEIANLEGEHLRENEYQYQLIERIVEMAIDIENHDHIPSPCSNNNHEENIPSPYSNNNYKENTPNSYSNNSYEESVPDISTGFKRKKI